MSTATTTRGIQTEAVKGKEGYRAPELLLNSEYNKKADIWSLGCIVHELCVGRKAFSSDWAALQYANGRESFSVDIPGLDGAVYDSLRLLINEMLDCQPSERPDVIQLRRQIDEMVSLLNLPNPNHSTEPAADINVTQPRIRWFC